MGVRGAALAVVSVLATGVLVGCTGSPEPLPTPSSSTLSWPEPVVISGTGSGSADLPIPEGAQSLDVRLACSDGQFHISANFDLASDRRGMCGAMNSFRIPLSRSSPLRVTVAVPPESSFVAEFAFSSEALPGNATLAENCVALSALLSAITNAEAGFDAGDLDRTEWAAAIAEGKAALQSTSPDPLMAPLIAPLIAWVDGHTEPGSLRASSSGAQVVAIQVCAGNGSPVTIIAHYGG